MKQLTKIWIGEKGNFMTESFFLDRGNEYFYFNGDQENMRDLHRFIYDMPSTNGIYIIDAASEYRPFVNYRFFLVTNEFLNKFANDAHINTMSANPKYFYRGKHVPIKFFTRKLIERPAGLIKHDSKPKRIALRDISELKLNMRPHNSLVRAGFKTIGDLKKMSLVDLAGVPNMGKASVEEVVKALALKDIVLYDDTNLKHVVKKAPIKATSKKVSSKAKKVR